MTDQTSKTAGEAAVSADMAQTLAEFGLTGRAPVLQPGEAETQVAFVVDGAPSEELPPFPNSTNIGQLYGWKPGESLEEAMARARHDRQQER